MIKVLWLSNRVLDGQPDKQSGTWLTSLAPALLNTGEIELANISIGKVSSFTQQDFGDVKQWVAPNEKRSKKTGLPSDKTVKNIKSAVDKFNPDIIQVWGTENYWGLLTARGILPGKHLLNIQGVISSIERVYYGGLTNREIIKSHSLKEFIKPKQSLLHQKKYFQNRSVWEKEIIQHHKNIVVQSNWVRAHVEAINNHCDIFYTKRTLRNEFVNSIPWFEVKHNTIRSSPQLFTLSVTPPYKGLHVLIKSLAILKRKYPDIILKIGGIHSNPGIRRSGYERWLRNMIQKMGLGKNIQWLGPLSAKEIITTMQQSHVFVHPSFVESYSLAVAEAMAVGVPSVVSFAGALTELAEHKTSAMYFSPGDYIDCARNINTLLESPNDALTVSKNAIKASLDRSNGVKIAKNQLDIYNSILNRVL